MEATGGYEMPLSTALRKLLTILNAMLKHHTTWNPQILDAQDSC